MDSAGIEKKYTYIDHGGQFKKGQGGKKDTNNRIK